MANLFFNEEMFIKETLNNFIKANFAGMITMLVALGLSLFFYIEELISLATIILVGVIGLIGSIVLIKSWIDLMLRRRYLQNGYGLDVRPNQFNTRLANLIPKLYTKESYGLKMSYLLIPLVTVWLCMVVLVFV